MSDNNPQATPQSSRHVIIGAGPVGCATAAELARTDHAVTIVTRSGGGPTHPAIDLVKADAADPSRLSEIASGAASIINCASPPYHRWKTDWPPLADSILTAARASNTVLVTMSNLYGYGRPDGPMTEDQPLDAHTRKGRIRADMWRTVLRAHEAGDVRATEARASDFIGAGLGSNSHMGDRMISRVIAGRSASVIGNPDVPHSWTAIEDVARTLVVLATDERAWGRAWHVPTGPALTQRELIDAMAQAAGCERVSVRALPKPIMRLAGLVIPAVRELIEIAYQFEEPFVIDSSSFSETFGFRPTPLAEVLGRAVSQHAVGGTPQKSLTPG